MADPGPSPRLATDDRSVDPRISENEAALEASLLGAAHANGSPEVILTGTPAEMVPVVASGGSKNIKILEARARAYLRWLSETPTGIPLLPDYEIRSEPLRLLPPGLRDLLVAVEAGAMRHGTDPETIVALASVSLNEAWWNHHRPRGFSELPLPFKESLTSEAFAVYSRANSIDNLVGKLLAPQIQHMTNVVMPLAYPVPTFEEGPVPVIAEEDSSPTFNFAAAEEWYRECLPADYGGLRESVVNGRASVTVTPIRVAAGGLPIFRSQMEVDIQKLAQQGGGVPAKAMVVPRIICRLATEGRDSVVDTLPPSVRSYVGWETRNSEIPACFRVGDPGVKIEVDLDGVKIPRGPWPLVGTVLGGALVLLAFIATFFGDGEFQVAGIGLIAAFSVQVVKELLSGFSRLKDAVSPKHTWNLESIAHGLGVSESELAVNSFRSGVNPFSENHCAMSGPTGLIPFRGLPAPLLDNTELYYNILASHDDCGFRVVEGGEVGHAKPPGEWTILGPFVGRLIGACDAPCRSGNASLCNPASVNAGRGDRLPL